MSDPSQASQIPVWQVFVGFVIGSGVIGIILNYFLGREFERFKTDFAKELERFKTNLQKELSEGQVQFKELHTRQVETLDLAREKLQDLRTCFGNVAYGVDSEGPKLLSGDLKSAPFRELNTAHTDSLLALIAVNPFFDEPFIEEITDTVLKMVLRFHDVFQQEDLNRQRKFLDAFMDLINSTMELVDQKAHLVHGVESGKSGERKTRET